MGRLRRAFKEFDGNNPRIWELFVRFTFDVLRRGYTRFGVASIIERVRWEVNVATVSDDPYKINNNHRAYYARKWIELYPEHKDLFAIRQAEDDDTPPPTPAPPRKPRPRKPPPAQGDFWP